MSVDLPPDTRQEGDPPDVRLVVAAGITILARIVQAGTADADDVRRVAAYRRALIRLRDHLNEEQQP